MTPTRAQYDAVLTRSSAGVRALSGDLDDDEDRNTALDWLENITRQASTVEIPCQQVECCHNCRHLIADHHHPVTDGESILGRKGWVCAGFLMDEGEPVVFSGWGEHGMCEMFTPRDSAPSVHESGERGSDGTHGPREPENDTEPFELTKALKACHATPNPQPEFRTDPELDALLDEEEAIARGDRTTHMSARVVASNDWPPPAKGTHEWDLWRTGKTTSFGDVLPGYEDHTSRMNPPGGSGMEYITAQHWSRSR